MNNKNGFFISYPKLIMTFCSLMCSYAYSQPHIQIVTEEWAPYNYTNESGQIVGSSTELVKAAMQEAGLDYTINAYSWQRAFELTKQQQNTFIYSILRTDVRETSFQWIWSIGKIKRYFS
jgi:polar amino acid transport system substrate-binding protein